MIRWLALALLLPVAAASAQITNMWLGGASATWGTASNWSAVAVPSATHVVVFDGLNGSNTASTLGGSYTINTLIVTNGYTNLVWHGGGIRTLTVSNQVIVSSPFSYHTDGGRLQVISSNSKPLVVTTNGVRFYSNSSGDSSRNLRLVNLGPQTNEFAEAWAFTPDDGDNHWVAFGGQWSLTSVVATNAYKLSALIQTGARLLISNCNLTVTRLSAEGTGELVVVDSALQVTQTANLNNYFIFPTGSVSFVRSSYNLPGYHYGPNWRCRSYLTNAVLRFGVGSADAYYLPSINGESSVITNVGSSARLHVNIASGVNFVLDGNNSLASAGAVADMCVTNGTFSTGSYTFTGGDIRSSGALNLGSSAIYTTNITSTGTVTPGTSTLYLLGGTSNLTNFYSLVPVGSCTLTGAAISVTGTLASQPGASLNAAGGTLTLSNPGLVDGNLQRATVTGNVLRVDGIADKSSGQLNTPRQGRR